MSLLQPYLNSITLGLVAIVVFSYHLLRRFKSRKIKAPPEPGWGLPIIGHLPLLAGSELPHIKLAALADKYGPIFTIRIGLYPNLVVSSWELAQEIFTTNDVNVSSRPQFTSSKLMGYDFANFGFSPYGRYWRELRKITASELLSNRRLELLKHVRASEVEGSIRNLYKQWTESKNEGNRVLVEMKQWFGEINTNVILRMVAGKRYFGAGVVDDENEGRLIQKAMREFFHLSGVFVLRDAIPFLGWLDLGGHEKAMKRIARDFDDIIAEWLEEHRRKRLSGGVANEEQDFMDVMLSVLDGVDLSCHDADTVRKATSMTIISGGTDTTTVSITWVLALLLNHPLVLRKAQEELDFHVGKERLAKESDIDKLAYLQAVVKEALRLYPAGPLSGPRQFAEGCTVGGYYIPAGTRLLVNIHKIQRDPRVWLNPMEFDPERFLGPHKDVDVMGQHFVLMPFGGGRRACPGIAFGIQMIHLLLASILQAFEFSTPSSAQVDMTGSVGLTNSKVTPLEALVKPRLPPHLYE
uniref:Putative cytochrome P450 family protein n=1 Tax=Rhizophora mucronata TaxID=61149 RepID=A0A2P2NFT1_RHIMU